MFIVVLGRNPVTTLDAYLYDHAERIATLDVGERFVALVRTANDEYLTNYQADRIGSGLMGAAAYRTFDEAMVGFNEAATHALRVHKPIAADL